MEEGTEVDVPTEPIGLIVGESARFRFFSSANRRTDQPGDLLTRWSPEELTETDALETTLPASASAEAGTVTDDDYVPVTFNSRITELGVLELWCVHESEDKRWKLEFSVRDDAES